MFTKDLGLHIRAGFSGIWVHTQEPEEAVRSIAQLFKENNWVLAVWDVATGIRGEGAEKPDPISVLGKLNSLSDGSTPCALALMNYHMFIKSGNPTLIQSLCNAINEGRRFGRFIMVLSHDCTIPAELERLFVVVEHPLPDAAELTAIAQETVQESEMPKGEAELRRVLDASAGLTRMEAEGSFALSVLSDSRKLEPETIWTHKANGLKKTGLITLYRHTPGSVDDLEPTFANLGGLTSVKEYTVNSIRNANRVRPKGILMLGVPGSGKSAFAKALGREVGWPTLILDFGALYGGIVGQTEGNIRKALSQVDFNAPCILFIDELEKAMSGGGQSASDGGVSQRMLGTLLTWLNDHQSQVYFIGTCNDQSKLAAMSAGAFTRAERFDASFFIDLPNRDEKNAIWNIYRKVYQIDANDPLPDDKDWTGAEIKSCCRQARMLGSNLIDASQYIVPVCKSSGEQIESMRTWATGRCLSATNPGVYFRDRDSKVSADTKGRRTVTRSAV